MVSLSDLNSKIIDGRHYAKQVTDNLRKDIALLAENNIVPKLAIVMVGNNPMSKVYIANKMNKAKDLGIDTVLLEFKEDIKENSLLTKIDELNKDTTIHGIIVQLPLPKQIDAANIQSAIDASKDVDGFNPINVGLLYSGSEPKLIACTPLGCLHLIQAKCQDIVGKHIVIIGRSNIVGRPLSSLLLREGATVTLCNSKTQDLKSISSKADIVVLAAGAGEFFGAEYFKKDAIVIDVGITKNPDGKLVGDVKFGEVAPKASFITPVPGGVGPMTIAYLMSNVVKACKKHFI